MPKKKIEFNVDPSIEPGYVYIIDYVVNDNIKGVTSFRVGHEDMLKSHIKRKHTSSAKWNMYKIDVINPRHKQKHY